MGIYVVTGGVTGIGRATVKQLRDAGHTVIVVDIHDADIIADLSTEAGRQAAIDGIHDLAPDGVDGFVPCAGIAPPATPASKILQVNFFGVVNTFKGILDLLIKKSGTVVFISSNSAVMDVDQKSVELLLNEDEVGASVAIDEPTASAVAYQTSKQALTKWMRRNFSDYLSQGVRCNAVAPGVTLTPLVEAGFADEKIGPVMKALEKMIPRGKSAQPDEIANVILFLLSDASKNMYGSVVFVDGGYDAMSRPDSF